jgi:pyruvate dehydrogenase E2 component (dihydrolipoamide acetyltransferase)
MSTSFTLPELGEGIDSATVVEIFVKPGDTIKAEQPLLSLETDKAQFELPATSAGTVEQVLVGAGDEVSIGQAILTIAGGGASAPAPAKPATPPEATPAEAPAAPAAGADAPSPPPPKPAARTEPARPPRPRGAVTAAPSVRRLARERGVRLEDVAAHTGDDRVTAAEVEAFLRAGVQQATPATTPVAPGLPPPQPLPDFSRWGEITVEEMSKIRRKTADNMARAWIEIPTVTHYDEADITNLEDLRKRYAARAKEAGGHLTWTAILLHVLAGALRRFPLFNASVDMAGNRIIYKQYVHIGVAVDTERGLLVPVIHDADRKNIIELAKALAEVSEAARNRNIKPELMQGATFTITNLGGLGGVAFSPIINPPQVAILGVSRSSTRPMWRDGRVEPRQILPLSLSYDHRIIDGADAARFMRWVCEALEEPFLLDLEGQ